ncbi:MAG: DUF3810 domain-containing protein [bacterium]
MRKQVKQKGGGGAWFLFTAVPVLAVSAYGYFSQTKELADLAVSRFSRPLREAIGAFWSLTPASGMELMYLAAGCGLLLWLIGLIAHGGRGFLKRLTALALAVAWLFSGYLWLWGIDYRASSFRDKTGFETHLISAQELREVAAFFTQKAMSAAAEVPRDAEGKMTGELDALLDASLTVYDTVDARFPAIAARSRRPKRMWLFSRVMSRMGFTGVFFPFTAESNINADPTLAFIPCTVAHELAHQRGVTSEQEANFLGVTAAVTSGQPEYTYSGWLTGSVYLMNALYRADREGWRELYATFSGGFLADWNANAAYWQSLQSPVTETSEKLYDTYLRANGQELGMQSYGACVDLIVAYFEAGGYA